jgi:hypothetical protein
MTYCCHILWAKLSPNEASSTLVQNTIISPLQESLAHYRLKMTDVDSYPLFKNFGRFLIETVF